MYLCLKCNRGFMHQQDAITHVCEPDRYKKVDKLIKDFRQKWNGVNQSNKAYQRALKALDREITRLQD